MQKINILLQRLAEYQENPSHSLPKGVFPSIRYYEGWRYQRADQTLFFSSLIVVILKQLQAPMWDNQIVELADKIIHTAYKSFHKYQNKAGGITYNFWEEHPKQAFPNSWLLFKNPHFYIPDDLDDTALAFMAKPHDLPAVYGLKRRAYLHVNTIRKTVKHPPKALQGYRTYTTWSGLHMYYEFDVCVLCNILCCFRSYGLPKDHCDLEAIALIEHVLLKNWHISNPYAVSHHYPTTPSILYHVAKLASYDTQFAIKWRTKLANDIRAQICANRVSMRELLLSNALMKLGESAPNFKLPNPKERFSHFIIGLMTAYQNPLAHWIAAKRFTWLHYHCEAYNVALLIEHLILKSQVSLGET